ncbi:MAG: hypothetical protein U5M51_15560 [Emticicia sp.]|nr:hypothetical protein [Emticicia sp.]
MKNLCFLAFFCCSMVTMAQKSTSECIIYTSTDVWPTYPKGYQVLYSSICSNINVPVSEIPTEKNKNTVFIKFVVEKNGSINHFEIMRGINKICDAEAIRVAKLMSNWNSGGTNKYNRFQPLRMYMTIPIKFFKNISDCESSYNQIFTKK